jgi:hypothetical protein
MNRNVSCCNIEKFSCPIRLSSFLRILIVRIFRRWISELPRPFHLSLHGDYNCPIILTKEPSQGSHHFASSNYLPFRPSTITYIMKSVHPIWVVFLAASISFAASSPTVFTSDSSTNHHARHPDKCKPDNLVKCFLKRPALASPFCSSYISLPLVTVTIQTSSTMRVFSMHI